MDSAGRQEIGALLRPRSPLYVFPYCVFEGLLVYDTTAGKTAHHEVSTATHVMFLTYQGSDQASLRVSALFQIEERTQNGPLVNNQFFWIPLICVERPPGGAAAPNQCLASPSGGG